MGMTDEEANLHDTLSELNATSGLTKPEKLCSLVMS